MGSVDYGCTVLKFYFHGVSNNLSNITANFCWLYCHVYFIYFSRTSFKSMKKKDLALWALIRTVQRLKLQLIVHIFNQLISLCKNPHKKKVVWHCGICYANFSFHWYSTFRWGMENPRILAVGVYSATNAKGDLSHPSLPWAQCQNNAVWDSCIFKSSLGHQFSGKVGLKPPD